MRILEGSSASKRVGLGVLLGVTFVALTATGLELTEPALAQAAKSVNLVVKLNPDRTKGGTLTVVNQDGKTILGPLPVLGKAANDTAKANGNNGADPLKLYGDTPSGQYQMKSIVSTSTLNQASYGPNGAVVLEPIGGEALVAKGNGRTGLWVHGGAPGTGGALRRTNGCLRISNDDMKKLVDAIAANSANATANRSEVQIMNVTVYPDGGGEGYNAGDPPPTGLQIIFP